MLELDFDPYWIITQMSIFLTKHATYATLTSGSYEEKCKRWASNGAE